MLLSHHTQGVLEAGCDEAGRGCLAGPVVAAAVIFPTDYQNGLINDSKQLSEKKRELLRPIIHKDALAWGVGVVWNERIDEINILNASFEAMNLAIDELFIQPELLLIDGNRFNSKQNMPHLCIVKGDGKYLSIAAASVLAKTYRDEIMRRLAKDFPVYKWQDNKGYPTKAHRTAISVYGTTSYHRNSFRLLAKD